MELILDFGAVAKEAGFNEEGGRLVLPNTQQAADQLASAALRLIPRWTPGPASSLWTWSLPAPGRSGATCRLAMHCMATFAVSVTRVPRWDPPPSWSSTTGTARSKSPNPWLKIAETPVIIPGVFFIS